jgi:16S rRNA processing protein RimM
MSERHVEIGKIYTTFGLKGDVKVYAYEESVFQALNGKDVWIEDETSSIKVKIESAKLSKKNNFLVKLEGFNNVGKSKRIIGKMITIEEDMLPPTRDDEYYFYQVVGMEVYDEDENYLGKVVDVIQTGSNDVFVVRDNLEKEFLIPSIKDYVLSMDKTHSKIKTKKMVWY